MNPLTRAWLRGLEAAVIGGVASAGSAFLGLAGAHGVGVNVQPLDLKQLGVVLVTSGLASAFYYLKQSPIPPNNTPPTTPPTP